MNTEEKAKAYDEALERAKDFMNGEAHYELKMGENKSAYLKKFSPNSKRARMRR